MATIVIDPGHGGTAKVGGSSANNATGPAGTLEKNLTLQVGLAVVDYFRVSLPKHRLLLTRSTDANLGLDERAAVAKSNLAPVLVSIHFNGDADPATQGTEAWVHTDANNESKELAGAVLDHVVGATRYRNRGVRNKDLGVLRPKAHHFLTAGCLVEISFLTDPSDEQRLKDAKYIAELAQALALGIESYLKKMSIA